MGDKHILQDESKDEEKDFVDSPEVVEDELSVKTDDSPDSLEEYINELNQFIDESNGLGDEIRKLILESKLSSEDELNKNSLFDRLDKIGEEFSHNVDKLDPEGIAQSIASQNTDLIESNKQEEQEKEITTYDEDGYDNSQEEEYDEEEEEEEYYEIEPLGDSIKEIINSDISIKKKIIDILKVIIEYFKYWLQEKFKKDSKSEEEIEPESHEELEEESEEESPPEIEEDEEEETEPESHEELEEGSEEELPPEIEEDEEEETEPESHEESEEESEEELPPEIIEEEESEEELPPEIMEDEESEEEIEPESHEESEEGSEEESPLESHEENKSKDISTKRAKRDTRERIRRIRTVRGLAEMMVVNSMPVVIGIEGKCLYKPINDYEKECFASNPYFKKGADELQKVFNQIIAIEIAKHFIRKDKDAKEGLVKSICVIFSSIEHAYILQAKEKGKLRCFKIKEDKWSSFELGNEFEAKPKKMTEVLKAKKGNLEKVTKVLDYYNIGLKNMLIVLKDMKIDKDKNIKIKGQEINSHQKENVKKLLKRVNAMSTGFLKNRKYEKNKIKVIDDYCYKIQK